MAFQRLSAVVLLALAAAVVAEECKLSLQPTTATLANVSPKGCLKQVVNATGTEDLVKPDCFNKLKMNITSGTGTGCPDRTFTVAFNDQENCAAGFDEIANGTMSEGAKGVMDVKGAFLTGTPFKGSDNGKGEFKVSVEGSKCELTYALKDDGKAIDLSKGSNATDAKGNKVADAKGKASDAVKKAGEAVAGKKSGAGAVAASGLLAAAAAAAAVLAL